MIENLFCSLVQSCTHFLGRISIICDICGNFVAASRWRSGATSYITTSPHYCLEDIYELVVDGFLVVYVRVGRSVVLYCRW